MHTVIMLVTKQDYTVASAKHKRNAKGNVIKNKAKYKQ
jgi:hypothetical protein